MQLILYVKKKIKPTFERESERRLTFRSSKTKNML